MGLVDWVGFSLHFFDFTGPRYVEFNTMQKKILFVREGGLCFTRRCSWHRLSHLNSVV